MLTYFLYKLNQLNNPIIITLPILILQLKTIYDIKYFNYILSTNNSSFNVFLYDIIFYRVVIKNEARYFLENRFQIDLLWFLSKVN